MHPCLRPLMSLLLVLALALILVGPTSATGAGILAPGAQEPAPGTPGPVASDSLLAPLIREWDPEVERLLTEPVPEIETGIGPGSALRISHSGVSGSFLCTANFVWTDDSGRLYLGTAGHCLLPEGKTATHGPDADHDRHETTVLVRSGACPVSAQNLACAAGGSSDPWVELDAVAYALFKGLGTDFGIVEIPPEHENQVRYELPAWGGPTTEGTLQAGDPILHYGQGVAYGETFVTRARAGVGATSDNTAWQTLGISNPGDSGSGVVSGGQGADATSGEHAVGILTHGLGAQGVGVPGVFSGTHIDAAKRFVADHLGIRLWTLPGGAPLPGLEPPPPDSGTHETLAPGTVVINHKHNETTTTRYNYTWTNEWDTVRIILQADTEDGEGEVTIRDETGQELFSKTLDSENAGTTQIHDVPENIWNLRFDYQNHTGSLALRIEAVEEDDGGGNETPDPVGQADRKSESLPAPGLLGVLLVLGVLATIVRRGARRCGSAGHAPARQAPGAGRR